jgi:Domain of unknown function (DUF5122) beta-propeller
LFSDPLGMENKTAKYLTVLVLLLTIIVSCSKKQASKQVFKFQISAFSSNGHALDGGSFVRAISDGKSSIVKLDANNSASFPNGIWEFQAVSFEGPTPFAGRKYCGRAAGVNLGGADKDVELNITEANCLVEPFVSLIAEINTKFNGSYYTLKSHPCFNGIVNAIAEMPATKSIIVGGNFTQVGPCTGSGVPIDQSTGKIHNNWDFSSMNINGSVLAAISDETGGWYISGDFTKVGTKSRRGVARIYADGTLYLSFAANFSGFPISSGSVRTLALDSRKLYIGGSFNANTLNFGSPLDSTTGITTYTSTQINQGSFDGPVSISVPDGSGGWYVGGYFNSYRGEAVRGLIRINSTGERYTNFNPNPNNLVNSIAISDSTVYAGGQFTSIGGQVRNRLAALDATREKE